MTREDASHKLKPTVNETKKEIATLKKGTVNYCLYELRVTYIVSIPVTVGFFDKFKKQFS